MLNKVGEGGKNRNINKREVPSIQNSRVGDLTSSSRMYFMLLSTSWFLIKPLSSLCKTLHRKFLWHYQPFHNVLVPVHEIWYFFCLVHNLWYICYLLLHVYELSDTLYHRYLSRPLLAYQHLSIIPILHLSFSSMLVMLILVLKGSAKDLFCIFWCTYYIKFRIHLPVITYSFKIKLIAT